MYQNGDRIDGKALIAAVRELAAERPDFEYPGDYGLIGPSCYYTTESGDPDCIIGCAMDRIGQPLPAQQRGAGSNECDLLNGPVADRAWQHVLDGITWEQYRWLCSVQSNQDQGHSWGRAVRYADQSSPC